jgi:hypothetical protein
VLAGAPAFEVETLPVGPYWLVECLRVGSLGLNLHADHVEHFFRLIEQTWWASLPQLYDDANGHLAEARILPNLQGSRTQKTRPAAQHPPAHAAPAGAPRPAAPMPAPAAPMPPAARAPEPLKEPAPAEPVRGAPIAYEYPYLKKEPPAQAPLLRDGAVDLSGFDHPLLGWPTPGQPSPGLTPENDTQDADLYDRMRDLLLARHRAHQLRHADEPVSPHQARSEDVQQVLALMQKRPIAPIVTGGKLIPRSIGHVKQDLVNKLREFTPDGKPPRIAEADADTLELVGMLFDELSTRTRPETPGQSLLTRLQIPMLRMALADKRFFTRRLFPARQFLDAVVEGALEWASDEPEDRAIAEKIGLLVDRAVLEFRGDASLFTELHSDFIKHQQTLTRKAEVAERRHVEAARGREKLEQSRRMAAAAIAERVARAHASGLVRALLEQAWTDVLALTLMRHGEHSPGYLTKLAVADRLLEATGKHDAAHPPPDATALEFLRHELESGLAQVGSHSEDIQRLLDGLFGAIENQSEIPTPSDLAVILKARTRLGAESVASLAQQFAPKRGVADLNETEVMLLDRLKALPQGAWIDIGPTPSEIARRKLSWTSGLSDRCLIVNQRGGRVDEPPLTWLAREMARGRARVVTTQIEQPVDTALRVVLQKLRAPAE